MLAAEVLHWLEIPAGATVVDATAGRGGHTRLLAAAVGPTGRVVAIDRDRQSLEIAADAEYAAPVEWVQATFGKLGDVLHTLQVGRIDAVLADFGVSSPQLDRPERGFSFLRDGPLDMRMDPTSGRSAAERLAATDAKELAGWLWHYGEERHSRRIAARILSAAPQTTKELADVVRAAVRSSKGHRRERERIDPATRSFQALRIVVNDELGEIERLFDALPRVLKPGGRAACISFHSLEDRLVKRAFQQPWAERLFNRPVTAGEAETARNPRSRSAKLRVVRRQV